MMDDIDMKESYHSCSTSSNEGEHNNSQVRRRIRNPSEVRIGDKVSFWYFCLPHAGIVSHISCVSDQTQTAAIKCIHYGCTNLFATRTIMEEEFRMDLSKSTWYFSSVPFNPLQSYSGTERLLRAKQRIGEKRWQSKNRSEDFCNWAVFRENETADFSQEERDQTSTPRALRSFFKPVYIADELEEGDVVVYKETGILVTKKPLRDGNKQLCIDVIVAKHGKCLREKFVVNLNEEHISKKYFDPSDCVSRKEMVTRAKQMEGRNVCARSTNELIEKYLTNKD
ncbi:uncharacterized protein LOC128225190 [Mya arenaria]|uniref:uncharacterized protein LOC128225190 n=1 Tax=Mya arenaria TaxID=6604 RepID=UPI0022E0EB69|nr:uncharacterized protein LOC128225190 [Mya arenaria]